MKKIILSELQFRKNVLNETWTSVNGQLKSHLKNIRNMDDDTLLRLSNIYPEFYIDYLKAINPNAEDEDYIFDLYDVADNNTEYSMSYFIKKYSLPIDQRFGWYVINTIRKHPRYYKERVAKTLNRFSEIPDNVTLLYKKPFLNKPLIHFCHNEGDAEKIMKIGFKYGAELKNLAWTYGYKNEKGNYGFAYLLDYLINGGNDRIPSYGTEGVVFIGSGVIVNHYGDSWGGDKPTMECIFDKDSVKEFICRFKLSHGYCEIYDKNNRLIYKNNNMDKAKLATWVSNNLIKY